MMSMMNDDSAILSAVSRQVAPASCAPSDQKIEVAAQPQKKWTLPGFFGKSKVQTSFGNLPIEALRRRDQLKTINGNYVEVEWVDQIRLDVAFLEQHPEAHPVYIPKDTFGSAMPNRNMLVSPNQTVKSSGYVGEGGLQTALELTSRPHITRLPHAGFIYYLFHCSAPVVVNVDGVWVGNSPG